jgi:hypothetical protein
MRILRRRPVGTDANESVIHAHKVSVGGVITAIGTVVALVLSAFSLWETSLKQAELSVHIPGVVTYARDASGPDHSRPAGGFEVLAVPLTIANGGARDAAVVALGLDVKNIRTGLSAHFRATYIAEPSFFNPDMRAVRQKTPFSALVVAGRSAWRGSVIFYPVSYSNGKALTSGRDLRALFRKLDEVRQKYATKLGAIDDLDELRAKVPDLPEWAEMDAYRARVLNPKDKIELTLNLARPAPRGWLDRLLDASVPPITLTLDAPDFEAPDVEAGQLLRLSSPES